MAALRYLFALLILMVLACPPASSESLAQLPTDDQLAELTDVMKDASAPLDLGSMIRTLAGGGAVGYQDVLDSAKAALRSEMARSLLLLFELLIPALLVAVLGELMGGSDKKALAAGFICYLVAALALMAAFREAAAAAMTLARDVGRFIEAMFPILTALLAACGATITAAAYAPLLSLGAGILSASLTSAAMGLCSFASVVAVFGSLSERFSLGKLLDLSKQLLNWLTGLTLTAFLGLVAAQNLLSGAQDSAALRASKYAAKNLIPGVGGEVADTLATVGASAAAVKNAVGVTGLVALALLCLAPLVRLFAAMLTAKVAAALFEPLGGGPLGKLIERFETVFGMLLVAGCASVVVGVILIGAALSAGGAAVVP